MRGPRNLAKFAFYAGAALPQNLWDALEELSVRTVGRAMPMVSAWGSTETSPLATDCHFQATRSGNIGVPIPGTEFEIAADLVLLAMGFVHPVHEGLLKTLGIDLDPRGFPLGSAATSTISLMGVQLWQTGDTRSYDVAIFRSVSQSFWRWLTASAAEFGYEVTPS